MKTYEIKTSRSRFTSMVIAVLLIVMVAMMCMPYFKYGKTASTYTPADGSAAHLAGKWIISGTDAEKDGYKEITISEDGKTMTVGTTNIIRVHQEATDKAVEEAVAAYDEVVAYAVTADASNQQIVPREAALAKVHDYIVNFTPEMAVVEGLSFEYFESELAQVVVELPADAPVVVNAEFIAAVQADAEKSYNKLTKNVKDAKEAYETAMKSVDLIQSAVNTAGAGATIAYSADASYAWVTEDTEKFNAAFAEANPEVREEIVQTNAAQVKAFDDATAAYNEANEKTVAAKAKYDEAYAAAKEKVADKEQAVKAAEEAGNAVLAEMKTQYEADQKAVKAELQTKLDAYGAAITEANEEIKAISDEYNAAVAAGEEAVAAQADVDTAAAEAAEAAAAAAEAEEAAKAAAEAADAKAAEAKAAVEAADAKVAAAEEAVAAAEEAAAAAEEAAAAADEAATETEAAVAVEIATEEEAEADVEAALEEAKNEAAAAKEAYDAAAKEAEEAKAAYDAAAAAAAEAAQAEADAAKAAADVAAAAAAVVDPASYSARIEALKAEKVTLIADAKAAAEAAIAESDAKLAELKAEYDKNVADQKAKNSAAVAEAQAAYDAALKGVEGEYAEVKKEYQELKKVSDALKKAVPSKVAIYEEEEVVELINKKAGTEEELDNKVYDKLAAEKAKAAEGYALCKDIIDDCEDIKKDAKKAASNGEKAITNFDKEFVKYVGYAQQLNPSFDCKVEEVTVTPNEIPELVKPEYQKNNEEPKLMVTEGKVKYNEKKGELTLTFANGEQIVTTYSTSFEYDGVKEIATLGYVGFPYNAEQFTSEMVYKIPGFYINDVVLVPIVLLVIAVLGVVFCFLKKDKMSAAYLPLAFAVVGLIGYAVSDFLKLGEKFSNHMIGFGIIALISIIHIAFAIKDKKAK